MGLVASGAVSPLRARSSGKPRVLTVTHGPSASPLTLWGSEIRFGVSCGQSGGDVVLVGESAEDLLPADPELGEVDRFRRMGVSLSRGELAEGTVRPGSVIVPQVLGQRSSQVVLIDDQDPVQELPAQGADDSLADRVRSGRLRRVLTEYLRHYNAARPHRALGQLTPAQAGTRPPEPVNLTEHRIRRKQVLGGLTHEYYVAA